MTLQLNPQLYSVGKHPYIPEEAFLYFPSGTDFKIGQKKQSRRHIFEGGVEYDEFQNQVLKQFDDYLTKKKIVLDQFWDRAWRLRFLQSTGYDIKKTLKDIETHNEYLRQTQILQLTPMIQKHLENGLFRLSGRDCKYRPILIVDVKKIVESELKQSQLIEIMRYFFEFILRNLLISGQVQNWIAIIDVGYQNLFSMISALKTAITFLSDTYKCRMYVTYLVKCSMSVSLIWKIVKNFMHEDTIQKINFMDGQTADLLLEYANLSQIEKQFGGTLNDMIKCWPISFGNQYKSLRTPISLISVQQYQRLYAEGKLHKRRIKQSLIKKEEQKLIQYQKINNKFEMIFLREGTDKINRIDCRESHPSKLFIKLQPPLCYP